MNVRMNVFATLIDVVLLVVIGVGAFFVPLILVWGLDDGFSSSLGLSWAAAVDTWFLGHGVPLTFSLDSGLLQSLALTDSLGTFNVEVALLGVCSLTVFWGYRLGRRSASQKFPISTWITGIGGLLVLSFCLVFFLPEHVASISIVEALTRPALFLSIGLLLANWTIVGKVVMDGLEKVFPGTLIQILHFGFKTGTASLLALLGVSSVVLSVILVTSFAKVISLYEALQPGAWGIVALSVAQLAMIPTAIIWVSNWLVGPGIALGSGALVTPVGTNLSAVPALPIFGILPEEGIPLGISVVIVPVVISVVAGVVAYPSLDKATSNQHADHTKLGGYIGIRPIKYICASLAAGTIGGLFGLSLSAMVSGAAGPGRFEVVGADPVQILLWFGGEVALGALIGIVSRTASSRVASSPR